MFVLTRRFYSILPLAWLAAGLVDSLALLMLPSLMLLGWLIRRHLRIVGLVGVTPWASVGFARHVTVEDLLRLAGWTALSPLPFLAGLQIRQLLLPG
ncbi:hypothetical protein SAMN05216456_0180 [Devosia crocina]|uniref:Uncharacterized protein n=1 Tax=Devosia crocina TaxID=429728 RepID=A0A1I7MX92_9HYPH|nr:hypothetical protein [Devosia crocina]SFV27031.1 hypothetical protein SAMN05216456_0180 [Devosia crocina]